MKLVDPHTFGGSKASEKLAEILNNEYPRSVRRTGMYYNKFSDMMSSLMYSWKHFHGGNLLHLMGLYKCEKFKIVQAANLPEPVKSHLLNVMTIQYRTYKNAAKELIEKHKPTPKQKFHVGQRVTVTIDIRDSYGEIYISKGDMVKVNDYHENQVGYEYELPWGFCVGADTLRRV